MLVAMVAGLLGAMSKTPPTEWTEEEWRPVPLAQHVEFLIRYPMAIDHWDTCFVALRKRPALEREQAAQAFLRTLKESKNSSIRERMVDFLGSNGLRDESAIGTLKDLADAGRGEACVEESILATRARAALLWKYSDEVLLREATENKEFRISNTAAGLLAERDEQLRYIPLHLETLNSPNAKIRMNALNAIGMYREKAAQTVPRLISILQNDPDVIVRNQCAAALQVMGPAAEAAIPALTEAMKTGSASRQYVARALASIGPRALPGLILLLGEQDSEVRKMAAFSIQDMRGDRSSAIGKLVELLGDEEKEVRRYSADALLSIGAPALPQLGLPTDHVDSLLARRALIFRISPAVESVKAAFAVLPAANADSRYWATNFLFPNDGLPKVAHQGELNQAVLPHLLDLLKDAHPWVRRNACFLVAKLSPNKQTALALVARIGDDDEDVCSSACIALLHYYEASDLPIEAIDAFTKALPRAEAFAVRNLARFGPKAKASLPAIRSLEPHPLGDPEYKEELLEAIAEAVRLIDR